MHAATQRPRDAAGHDASDGGGAGAHRGTGVRQETHALEAACIGGAGGATVPLTHEDTDEGTVHGGRMYVGIARMHANILTTMATLVLCMCVRVVCRGVAPGLWLLVTADVHAPHPALFVVVVVLTAHAHTQVHTGLDAPGSHHFIHVGCGPQ